MKTLNIQTKPKPPYSDWTIGSHTPIGEIDLDKIEFHLEPKQKMSYLKGDVLRERLAGKKNLDGALLDYLLKHPKLIPDSWKTDENGNTRYIFFWGTIYRDSGGRLCVRCLCWLGGEWGWGSLWLGGGWDGSGPAAVLASSTLSSKTSELLDPQSLVLRVQKLEEDMAKIRKFLII